MRGVLRPILIAIFATASALTASAAPGGRHARDHDVGVGVAIDAVDGVLTQVDDDDRWGGGRRGWRRGERDHDRARDGVMSGRLLPLEAVLANVARVYPGYHIGVEGPYQLGGRWCYRIKWLTPDGRVLFILADAETGQILGQRGGR
jgi:hypothetical protein